MQDFEKLGLFYLGAEYDIDSAKRSGTPFLYESRDLVTHAVIIGMTGSGKTGLGICLLEEAAIDGIPSIVIDPKGDLSNMLLTFPEFRAQDFRPWINEEEARNKAIPPEELAAREAEQWRKGLAEWGQDPSRIERFRSAADPRIYTPGSNAGLPVALLQSFSAPPQELLNDAESYRQRISSTVSGLLGLLGIDTPPLQSRDHILLSTILEANWRKGSGVDLAALIGQIQEPPFERVGVLDTETFYPARDRFALAMAINNLLAAPGFDLWLQGEPLNIGKLLHTDEGKPRVSIFSIAHLNDVERMFFVTVLLTELLGWMRTQPGTTSLRSILYMDEIFGYFPPVANPPAKQPLLTLLKQARAFGVGIVLATQNPVDLDYKGLANTGTWFIGRLQTERDKSRLIDGLEGVAAAGSDFDRARLDQTISALSTRRFLMRNIHEEKPVVFESRWSLSYLRGPLTRDEIKRLMDPVRAKIDAPVQAGAVVQPPSLAAAAQSQKSRPVLPPEVQQYFVPLSQSPDAAADIVYRPVLIGSARIFYADPKAGIATEQSILCMADFSEETLSIDWNQGMQLQIPETDLDRFAVEDASYEQPAAAAAQPKSYAVWSRHFANWLYSNQNLEVWKSAVLDQTSLPGESERDFRIRLQQMAREARDRAVEKIRQKFAPRSESLQERIRRAEQAVMRESQQADQQKVQTAISFGTTVLGALFGRKRTSTSTLGRATTAARGVGRSMKESQDIARAQETVAALQKQLSELEERLQIETEELSYKMDPENLDLRQIKIRPKKTNIQVRFVALAWVPYLQDEQGGLQPAFHAD